MKHKTTILLLKCLLAAMSLYMTYLVFATSVKSNLWDVLPALNQEPWFTTTILDFYFNITIISLWTLYKEKNIVTAIVWIIAFVCLGSIATALYVLIQILKLKENESSPFEKILLRKDARS